MESDDFIDPEARSEAKVSNPFIGKDVFCIIAKYMTRFGMVLFYDEHLPPQIDKSLFQS